MVQNGAGSTERVQRRRETRRKLQDSTRMHRKVREGVHGRRVTVGDVRGMAVGWLFGCWVTAGWPFKSIRTNFSKVDTKVDG